MEIPHTVSFAKRRTRHRRPIPIVMVAALAAAVTLAGCEDFQLTDHTVMDGQPPPEVFAGGVKRRQADQETIIHDLHAKIGELTVERDFLSRGLGN